MGTWFGYTCLSHDPKMESERWFHGHGNVDNSGTAQTLREIAEVARGKDSVTSPQDFWATEWRPAFEWLAEHPRCRIAVADGYGSWRELAHLDPVGSKPEPELKLAGEIRPGGWYVLETDARLTAELAQTMRTKLAELFPGTTFAILDGKLKLVTEYPDLLDALKRARTTINQEWGKAPREADRVALSGAAYALDYLARELATPERDGAGALPADPAEPVVANASPAPSRLCPESSDGLHNRVQMLDGDNRPMGGVHCGFCGAPR